MENYILANCTNVGKVREVNEDSMVTFDSPNGRVVTVCDGMGGQNAGDVASQLAVAVIQDILTDNAFPTPEEAITRSIMAANQAILHRAAQDVELTGMGSTCVMVIIKDGKVYYGSVGDSRIYYIAGGQIRQITKDQSYVQTLVDAGEITQEAAEHHQDKNQITNALGLEGMTPPVVGQIPITPEPGSVFLLCSDGLSGMVSNQAILSTVSNSQVPLSDRAQQLVGQALAAGGLDNVTVQLVEFPAGGMAGIAGGAYGSQSAPQKSHTLLYAICALALLLVIGGGIYYFLRPKDEPVKPKTTVVEKPKAAEPAAEKKVVVEQKTVTTEEVKRSKRATKRARVEDAADKIIKGKKSKKSIINPSDAQKLKDKDKTPKVPQLPDGMKKYTPKENESKL